ncbi:hypothetical protein BpHYR1_025204 [Brachionus plicatilis]|uniref:RNA-directed DNA polymerase from mobile element jockey-like n=1 Tax=Brachionus plicatilis TaxID=10195 RepID=A0A3M7PPK3_BRAPC|nr:hypothetical protein BpHYR1_025204 [Brachionus plicatilis]
MQNTFSLISNKIEKCASSQLINSVSSVWSITGIGVVDLIVNFNAYFVGRLTLIFEISHFYKTIFGKKKEIKFNPDKTQLIILDNKKQRNEVIDIKMNQKK